MLVHVHHITHEPGSTIAIGAGCTPDGWWVTFAGDHRPMALMAAAVCDGDVLTDVPDWALLTVIPLPDTKES